MRNWREGISLARITWRDEQGAEYLCVATERSWVLAQSAVIECERGDRAQGAVLSHKVRKLDRRSSREGESSIAA